MVFGRHNHIGDKHYLSLYVPHDDVMYGIPQEIKDQVERAAHIKYNSNQGRKSITVLRITDNENLEQILSKIRIINPGQEQSVQLTKKELDQISHKYGMNSLIASTEKENLKTIRSITTKDVLDYNVTGKFNPSEIDESEFNIQYADKIRIKPKLAFNGDLRLTHGKSDFHPACTQERDVEPTRGCISATRIEDKVLVFDPDQRCFYCYAEHRNSKVYIKNLKRANKKVLDKDITETLIEGINVTSLKQRRPVIRIGKWVDGGIKEWLPELIKMSQIILDYKYDGKKYPDLTGKHVPIQMILPTKYGFIGADDSELKELAKLFDKTRSTIQISLYDDKFEPGTILYGMDTESRIARGEELENLGFDVVYRAVADVTLPQSDLVKRLLKEKKRVLVTGLKIPNPRKKADILTGKSVEELVGGTLFTQGIEPRFKKYANGLMLYPASEHEDYLKLIGNNNNRRIRLCAEGKKMYSGQCFLPGYKGSISEIIPHKVIKESWSRKSQKKKEDEKKADKRCKQTIELELQDNE